MEENIQFLTGEKINVTNRIKEGKTSKFTCRHAAAAHAKLKGSYVYDLFCFVSKSGKDSRIEIFGYAVPN